MSRVKPVIGKLTRLFRSGGFSYGEAQPGLNILRQQVSKALWD